MAPSRRPNDRTPPASNSRDRSAVASPLSMLIPSSMVSAGTAECRAGTLAISSAVGPSISSRTAAVATAWVRGISRYTGTRKGPGR